MISKLFRSFGPHPKTYRNVLKLAIIRILYVGIPQDINRLFVFVTIKKQPIKSLKVKFQL